LLVRQRSVEAAHDRALLIHDNRGRQTEGGIDAAVLLLLVDEDRALGDAFGIESFKPGVSMYRRTTVVSAPDGTVAKTMEDVDPATHADDVLGAI